jgi:hypothetical protein
MIFEPVYCTREEVKASPDFKTTRSDAQIDTAIISGSRSVDSLCNRVFYPTDATRYFDYPNYQQSYPWKLYLDANELAAPATSILSGTVSIPIANVNFEPANYGPPYSRIELRRDLSSSFGNSTTPQRDVAVTGTFGYWLNTRSCGALAAAIATTSVTTITVSNGALGSGIGVGDILLIDSERLLVADKAMVSTGQTQQSGATTASMADQTLNVTDGTKFFVGETLLLDAERMSVTDIAGNALIVLRAYDGTTLATHSGATIYAGRLLTVTRGALGTIAATHLNTAAISKFMIPGNAKELAIAEAINTFLQKTSGYARTVGSGDNQRNASGAGLEDIRKRCYEDLGRKNRRRAV